MADYAISNVSRRVVYAASGTGPYAFTFEILAASDIAVYKGDTLLTLTTDYTVTINANGTGSVTLVTTAGTSQITIVGSKTIQRTTDFTTGGDFFANTLNDELDAQTIFIQQVAETAERGLKAPVTDPTDINMTLPRKADRALKTLSFDANGNPIAGIDASDVANAQTYATNASNSATAAASSASSASSSASSASSSASTASSAASTATTKASEASASASTATTKAGEASSSASSAASSASTATTKAGEASTSATNAAASASTASTAATNASSAQVAAEAARDATLAAYDNFDDRYLGAKASDPSVDNDGNALVAGALYFNTTSSVMKLYTGSAWVAAYVSGAGYLAAANNLSDLANASTARTNLGLGTMATETASNYLTTSSAASSYQPLDSDLTAFAAKTAPTGAVVGTSDSQTLTNKTIEAGVFTNGYTEETVSANTSTAYTIDLANGSVQILTLTGNCTLTFPANTAGKSFLLILKQDATGSRTITWDSDVKWAASTAPTITATASKADIYSFVCDGTYWYGAVAGQNYL